MAKLKLFVARRSVVVLFLSFLFVSQDNTWAWPGQFDGETLQKFNLFSSSQENTMKAAALRGLSQMALKAYEECAQIEQEGYSIGINPHLQSNHGAAQSANRFQKLTQFMENVGQQVGALYDLDESRSDYLSKINKIYRLIDMGHQVLTAPYTHVQSSSIGYYSRSAESSSAACTPAASAAAAAAPSSFQAFTSLGLTSGGLTSKLAADQSDDLSTASKAQAISQKGIEAQKGVEIKPDESFFKSIRYQARYPALWQLLTKQSIGFQVQASLSFKHELGSIAMCQHKQCLVNLGELHDHQSPRSQFNLKLIEKLKETVKDHQRPLSYVSFGSGSLLPDLFLISRLIEEGHHNIVVHFIDKEYTDLSPSSSQPTTQALIQFTTFLKHKDGLNIKVLAYPNVDSYLSDIKAGFQAQADILIATDAVADFTLSQPGSDPAEPAAFSLKDSALREKGIYGSLVVDSYKGKGTPPPHYKMFVGQK